MLAMMMMAVMMPCRAKTVPPAHGHSKHPQLCELAVTYHHLSRDALQQKVYGLATLGDYDSRCRGERVPARQKCEGGEFKWRKHEHAGDEQMSGGCVTWWREATAAPLA